MNKLFFAFACSVMLSGWVSAQEYQVRDNGDGTVTIIDNNVEETMTKEAWEDYSADLKEDGHYVEEVDDIPAEDGAGETDGWEMEIEH